MKQVTPHPFANTYL